MPELPEVETVRRLLEPAIIDRTIAQVTVHYWRMVQSDHARFVPTLVGRTFKKIDRVGKFLVFRFDTDLIMISHLRMEGKFLALKGHEPDSDYARVVFHFTDGGKLVYDDSRCFGIMKLTTSDRYLCEEPLTKVGPEPFVIESAEGLWSAYRKSTRPIKELLLDQTVMTGLGNIYADEVLFKARIHPELPGNLLTLKEAKRLLEYSKTVLAEAIEAGGSTVRTYHAAQGVDGRFQQKLLAYDRGGEPCLRCGHPLTKIKVKGRGSTYCPRCQINRAIPLVVAVTGTMHSGKSTLLHIAAERGYPALSSDALVKELYEEPGSLSKLESIIKAPFPNHQYESGWVLHAILKDPKTKKRLEKWVHPTIKKRVLAWIARQRASHVFIEVPLLYEAGWDGFAQYVIGVKVAPALLRKRIEADYPNPEMALSLAATNQFPSYEKRVDRLLVNDASYEVFLAEARQAIEAAITESIKAAQSADF
ncbi:MAG: bifunctional DNA-formamidopyrimidine glycosylase/DNA-(apurinic or apyrimidinic site) lyase [Bacilli bacterium]|jgi:formamidopyrimidine-DNA glycosylase